ncbi:MAG: hypothetical protein M1818_007292 [Claussenomyces sp. TS43310]|nr:MAG: hypothetical protein M1818_007292 [Claussenomyces sp. TS43310]
MDTPADEIEQYIGRPIVDLPTPSCILSKRVLENNCQRMLRDVRTKNLAFRAHVKTLKSAEVTRLMIGEHKKVIASTLREIRGLLELVDEARIDELYEYAQKVRIVLMLDHSSHVSMLEGFNKTHRSSQPWPVFVKIDVGTSRAGIPPSPRLHALIQAVEASPATTLHGLYCHAGHSYACCTPEDTSAVLDSEITTLIAGAALVSPSRLEPLLLSLGSTPTAHVISTLDHQVPTNCILEVHGGNYPVNDLQQLATGCVSESDQALRVIASVCSVYPERNEALVNAGVIALSREAGKIEGHGTVIGKTGWVVKRLSQEHGIVGLVAGKEGKAEEEFVLGDKLCLYIQHACITASAAGWYFVVDDDDIVREVWYPWKGW